MSKFNVYMSVAGTAVVQVEAETAEAAKKIAEDEYGEGPITICHQCSDRVSDLAYGDATEAVEIE